MAHIISSQQVLLVAGIVVFFGEFLGVMRVFEREVRRPSGHVADAFDSYVRFQHPTRDSSA